MATFAAGCADEARVDCPRSPEGITVHVALDETTTPPGQTPPTSREAPVVLYKADEGRQIVVEASTDASGCLAIRAATQALEPGHYVVEASINRGQCDWFDDAAFAYDGGHAFIQLTLTCQVVN